MYQHISVESLRRELQRNGQLRELCRLEAAAGIEVVAPAWAYTRFLKKLLKHEEKRKESRRDLDAGWGKKVYKGRHKDGRAWEKVKSWFGYKVHLIVDANYELPVAYAVTKASAAEQPVAHEMLTEMEESKSGILTRCEYFTGDRAYDDGKLITRVYDDLNT